MRIADILQQDRVISDVHARRKLDVIEELTAPIAKHLDGVSQTDMVRALMERERVGSTAIGEGLAIPHCKLDSVHDLVAALGRSRKGIDFGSADGQRTHFIFLLVSPADAAGSHLMALAQISRMFNDPQFRSRLMDAATADEMYRIIIDEESK